MIKISTVLGRLATFYLLYLFLFPLQSCEDYHRNSTHAGVSLSNIEKGEALAKTYCQSCHMLPDPSLVDSKSWEKGVLPQMGPRLGIFNFGFEVYPRVRDRNIGSSFYPSQPLLSLDEWQNIVDYYVATSPDTLPGQERKVAIKTGLSLFKVILPPKIDSNSATCYVKIRAADSLHPLMISDAISQNMYLFNRSLQNVDSIHTKGPIVDIDFSAAKSIACNIGILNPNNEKAGKAMVFHEDDNGMQMDSMPLFDSLQRPVEITAADLNNDGRTDYLVCEFGYLTGALSWMENQGSQGFKKHVLRPVPGAIKAYVQDVNHDGLPDLWVLFAQGEEGIFLFTNKGNGNFEQEEVLRFPPSWGSSYFELADFNKDGYPDILYTCGDNADFSAVLKPYHGVYIFMNDTKNHFTQKYFFPINGCYKAMARDFDGDGDLDIAAISFFADYAHQPEESFVYLQNIGNFDFRPYSFPEAGMGRWLTMDAGDFDGDGKIDIILGNFSIGPVLMQHRTNWKHAPPFIILKNTGK
jgi:FG-GAP-like repeat